MRNSSAKIRLLIASSLLLQAAATATVSAEPSVTASIPYPSFRIFAEGGALVPLNQDKIDRVSTIPATITHVSNLTGKTAEFHYTRQDCRTDKDGTPVCNTWNVREVKVLGSTAPSVYFIHNTNAGPWELVSARPNAGYNPPAAR